MYEEWFKEMWNAGVDLLVAVPEEATEPGTPWYSLMETMHGIAEDQPQMWGEDDRLVKL